MSTMPQIIGVSELQRTLTSFIQQKKQSSEPTFVVSRSKPQAVILSPERYEELVGFESAVARGKPSELFFKALEGNIAKVKMAETKAMKSALQAQSDYRQGKQ